MKLLLLLLSVCSCYSLFAKVTVPSIISNNMVLQQNTNVDLWGNADPCEKIFIEVSWSNSIKEITALSNGKWRTKIKTPKACKNQYIIIKGENTITIKNVLIGEVWLCTGQSNMVFPVGKQKIKWQTGMLTADEELNDSNYPEMRFFSVKYNLAPDGEKDNCEGEWLICNKNSAYDFSAVGFVFGRRIHKELNVPVGLILSAKGDTHVESWTKMSVMLNNPLYSDVLDDFSTKKIKQDKLYKVPSTLWNGMICPILGYTVKGNIWYQGEANATRYKQYQQVFTNMIESWRKEWGLPNMPFYYVQIAPFKDQPAGIREAQLKTWQSNLNNIGMVVITDAGDSLDIHPRNKRVVGERLALWALNKQYQRNVAYSGPLFKSMKKKDNKLILKFQYAKNGFKTINNEPIIGFYVAGNDKVFYKATALIKGKKIEVFSSQVKNPIAVRYGFSNFFHVNLYNTEGLPLVPFRSDTWELF